MKKNIFFFVLIGIQLIGSVRCYGRDTAPKKLLQPKGKLSIKLDDNSYSAPSLSPDGTKIAYKKPYNGVANIWVKTIGQTDDRLVTNERSDSVGTYCWSPQGDYILYRRDRQGDERYHLYKVGLYSGNVTDLTPFADAHMKIIGMNHNHPHEIVVEVRRNGSEWGHINTKPDAYRINISTGSYVKVASNPGTVEYWVADNNLKIRAAVSFDLEKVSFSDHELKKLLSTKTPDELYELFQRERGTMKMLTRQQENERESWNEIRLLDISSRFNSAIIGFTPDNTGLYVLESKDSDTNNLVELSANDGSTKEHMAHDQHCDLGILNRIDDPAPCVIREQTTGKIQAILCNRQKPEWIFFDHGMERDFQLINDKLGKGCIELISRDQADKKWIVSFYSDVKNLQWYLFDRGNKTLKLVFGDRDHAENDCFCPMKPVSFVARDGVSIQGYITYPHVDNPDRLPMVLLVHGGPLGRDNWGFNSQVQWLANQGYAVMQINYRGSSTFGKNFAIAGHHWKSYGTTAFNDLVDGVRWAIRQNLAHPQKIAIMGTSQGGYEALCGATFGADLFCCSIDICGPSNWELFVHPWQSSDENFKELLDQYWNKIKIILRSVSPVYAAERVQHPILLVHGRYDTRVPVENTEQFITALNRESKKYQVLIFEDEGHIINKSDNVTKMNNQIEKFLEQYLLKT